MTFSLSDTKIDSAGHGFYSAATQFSNLSNLPVFGNFSPHISIHSSGTILSEADKELIRQAADGSSQAFELLISQYTDRLFNTLVHLLRSREAAEDVMQNALFQAYLKLDTYRGQSAFYTWLYRIAVNMAFSYRRGIKPVISMDQQQEKAGEQPIDHAESVNDRVLREERAEVLHTAIGELSNEYRSVIILREIEGCSYDMIGEILSISPGTVRSRLHRARLQLKEKLLPMLKEHPSVP